MPEEIQSKINCIEFIGSLPPIQSAIQIDGQGDGGRVKIDIPRQYASALFELQKLAGKALRIMIEEDESFDVSGGA